MLCARQITAAIFCASRKVHKLSEIISIRTYFRYCPTSFLFLVQISLVIGKVLFAAYSQFTDFLLVALHHPDKKTELTAISCYFIGRFELSFLLSGVLSALKGFRTTANPEEELQMSSTDFSVLQKFCNFLPLQMDTVLSSYILETVHRTNVYSVLLPLRNFDVTGELYRRHWSAPNRTVLIGTRVFLTNKDANGRAWCAKSAPFWINYYARGHCHVIIFLHI